LSQLEYSKARLVAVLEEISRLKESEFPYQHSRDALCCIEEVYAEHLKKLTGLPAGKDPKIVNGFCGEALLDLFLYLPLLGFILRSTNIRNAFEVYGPILRLAQQILGPDNKLVLSSEWNFSPYTYSELTPLPKFVLIGLPASESENPLLLPLAGHELGHTIWQVNGLESVYYSRIESEVIKAVESSTAQYINYFPNHGIKPTDKASDLSRNLFVKKTIAPVVTWALSRAEEYFCDCVGVYLFDEAFLHSYAYLVAPKIACRRSFDYPNNNARISNMVAAADEFRKSAPGAYKIPPGYTRLFEDAPEPTDPEWLYISSLADSAASHLCPTLIFQAESLLKTAGAQQLDLKTKQSLLGEFRITVPANAAGSLTNILNAAWEVFNTPNLARTHRPPKTAKGSPRGGFEKH
jgi:hypothetical protein